jgi:hypothetical protein
MIRILVEGLVFFDQSRLVGLLIEFVKDKGLRRSVAGAFRAAPQAGGTFRFGFIAADLSLPALKTAH